MSNARDKANIPALNFSSTGIDDNATSTAITIDSSGNVGIGESSPDVPLHVTSADNSLAYFESTDANANIRFADGNSTGFPVGIGATGTSGNEMTLIAGGSDVVRIDSSGNVGIGTSSPLNPLTLGKITTFDLVASNTGQDALFINNASATAGLNAKGNSIGFGAPDGHSNRHASICAVQTDASDRDFVGLAFHTHNSSLQADPMIEVMRIAADGKVGIGTSSPTEVLHVVGDILATGGDFKSDANNYLGFSNNTFARFVINDSEKMRIDSSGKVGIGETSMDALLVIKGDSDENTTPSIRLKDGSDTREAWITNNSGDLILTTGGDDNVPHTQLRMLDGNLMTFKTNNTERMRIDSSGRVLINTTAPLQTTEEKLAVNNAISTFSNTASGAVVVNRASNDGDLVAFRQDGTQEGTISVSGSTVSYNGFTGTHWSRFTDNSTPTILKGTVLESLDEMCDWYNLEFDVITQDEDGNDVTTLQKIPHVLTDGQSVGDTVTYNHEGTDYQATIVKETDIKHMKSKVSDTADAKNVYGVFVAYDEDGEGYNDFYVASVGSFVVRIKANEIIAKGDLLQSNGDGTAKVQTDDAVRSSSFAKVLSTTIIETYEDGSYLVPCSLMC